MNQEFEPAILAFVCNWCTYTAADLAGTSRMVQQPNVRLVRMMCYDKRCGKARRWHVQVDEAWYGPSWTCLTCGRQSAAGTDGRVHRPLVGGFGSTERQRNIKRAREVLVAFRRSNTGGKYLRTVGGKK